MAGRAEEVRRLMVEDEDQVAGHNLELRIAKSRRSANQVGTNPPLIERRSAVLAILLVAIRVVSHRSATYTVFNHTADEPAHIASGMEWLDRHVYISTSRSIHRWRAWRRRWGRICWARSQGRRNGIRDGVDGGRENSLSRSPLRSTLALARLGILPFFWLACGVSYVWGKRSYGAAAAVIAVFFFSFLPPILAHAGLATTDMALTAFLGAAFLTGTAGWNGHHWKHGLLFGAATGLAASRSFPAWYFFPRR